MHWWRGLLGYRNFSPMIGLSFQVFPGVCLLVGYRSQRHRDRVLPMNSLSYSKTPLPLALMLLIFHSLTCATCIKGLYVLFSFFFEIIISTRHFPLPFPPSKPINICSLLSFRSMRDHIFNVHIKYLIAEKHFLCKESVLTNLNCIPL